LQGKNVGIVRYKTCNSDLFLATASLNLAIRNKLS